MRTCDILDDPPKHVPRWFPGVLSSPLPITKPRPKVNNVVARPRLQSAIKNNGNHFGRAAYVEITLGIERIVDPPGLHKQRPLPELADNTPLQSAAASWRIRSVPPSPTPSLREADWTIAAHSPRSRGNNARSCECRLLTATFRSCPPPKEKPPAVSRRGLFSISKLILRDHQGTMSRWIRHAATRRPGPRR